MQRLDEFLAVQRFRAAESVQVDPSWDLIRDPLEFQAVLEKHSN